MSDYRDIKQKHEATVVADFVAWLNRTSDTNWAVSERPNPPDAIITDGKTTSWVEHADLYRSWEEARSETSFVSPGKEHAPHSENPISDPDRRIAMELMALLQKKLTNCSYRPFYEKYGPGFLVISERDPFFDDATIAEIDRISEELKISNDLGYFKKLYLAIRIPDRLVYGELTYHRA